MASMSYSLSLLLVAMLARYWLTIWPLARRALKGWKELAAAIPDDNLRRLALVTHEHEHMNAEGAAIFATLAPWRWTPTLVRALVAYQVLFDYLDTITEQPTPDRDEVRSLHRALTDALDPYSDGEHWRALRAERPDAGYLSALVQVCRSAIDRLPAYREVAAALCRLAQRSGEVQALNHDAPEHRPAYLQRWAYDYSELAGGLRWWEFAASASSSLGVHTLLALATDRATTALQAERIEQSYCVTLGALNTLLESLVDLPLDLETGDHSFAAYYSSPAAAARRLGAIASTARTAAEQLPKGNRHAIILAGMVGFYLSAPGAWREHSELASSSALAAIGPPAGSLVKVLRIRRALEPESRPGPQTFL